MESDNKESETFKHARHWDNILEKEFDKARIKSNSNRGLKRSVPYSALPIF